MIERDGIKVARRLRNSILRLELRPSQMLDEAELSESLGVSRTPIREAIIQLIADGLVVRDGRKAKVAPFDFDDMPKLYDALLISSRMIHRLAAENRTQDDLDVIEGNMLRFETSSDASNGVERSEANLAFHTAIAEAAHNRYFAAFYNQALIGTIRLARACFANAPNTQGKGELAVHLKETIRQHRMILSAIESQDVEEADNLATLHYELTKARVQTILFSQPSVFTGWLNLSIKGKGLELS
ncbi:MAG: GntR family transcriptional regulator [Pseudomonadota bacterium]